MSIHLNQEKEGVTIFNRSKVDCVSICVCLKVASTMWVKILLDLPMKGL
jgi:hypothetical protein